MFFSQLQRELTLILVLERNHNFLKEWTRWNSLILAYGRVEAPKRSTVKTLVDNYDEQVAACSTDHELEASLNGRFPYIYSI